MLYISASILSEFSETFVRIDDGVCNAASRTAQLLPSLLPHMPLNRIYIHYRYGREMVRKSLALDSEIEIKIAACRCTACN